MLLRVPPCLILLATLWHSAALAQSGGLLAPSGLLTADALLRVDQAFMAQGLVDEAEVWIGWQIRPGYYMYRKQFRLVVGSTESTELGLPQGATTYDPFFDEQVEIYRDQTELHFSLPTEGTFYLRFQGCADAGYCYPPSWLAWQVEGSELHNMGLVAGPNLQPTAADASALGQAVQLPLLLVVAIFLGLILLGWTLKRL